MKRKATEHAAVVIVTETDGRRRQRLIERRELRSEDVQLPTRQQMMVRDILGHVHLCMRHPDVGRKDSAFADDWAAVEAMHEALSRHGHGKAYPSTIAHRRVIAAIRKFAATELRIASEKRGTLPAVDRAYLARALGDLHEATRDDAFSRPAIVTREVLTLAREYVPGSKGGRARGSTMSKGPAWLAVVLIVASGALGARVRDGETMRTAADRVGRDLDSSRKKKT